MANTTPYARLKRILPLVGLDGIAVVVSFWVALAFRFDGAIPPASLQALLQLLPFLVLLYIAINALLGLYGQLWRYASSHDALLIGASALFSTILSFAVDIVLGLRFAFPLSVIILGGVFTWLTFTAVRYRQRLLTGLMGYLQQVVGSPDRHRVLIIGAGEAGHHLAQQLKTADGNHRYELVGLVDDDPAKIGLRIHGAQVLGNRHLIPQIAHERSVGLIVIAIHRIDGPALRDILSICLATQARVKILPNLLGSIEEQHGVLPLRDIAEEDLLGRRLCEVDETACRHIITDKIVLVTGAAGSIGSELCTQILAFNPQMLIMVDNNESGLHELMLALPSEQRQRFIPMIGDVSDQARMRAIFARHHPQVIFHAAAYKHVPMMEYHPTEAVRVNIMGTYIVMELAHQHACERFVFISTDKAVSPSSIMGATKRIGELLMLAHDEESSLLQRSRFTAVRFGNVLGSRGSVAPRLIRQIEQGGPVTITHPEMTRYFISISEAVSLVIQAASMTEGGDLFMLDMGQPIRIEDLATSMIRLRGLRPGIDIPIIYTGVRPGEKLHEELVSSDEQLLPTAHPKILKLRPPYQISRGALEAQISHLHRLSTEQSDEKLSAALQDLLTLDRAGSLIARESISLSTHPSNGEPL